MEQIGRDVPRTIANELFKEYKQKIEDKNEDKDIEFKDKESNGIVNEESTVMYLKFLNKISLCVKENLYELLNQIFRIKIDEHPYFYYQGFHEIALYVLMLYENFEERLGVTQGIAEFYLKDFLVNNKIQIGLEMKDLIQITLEFIAKIDKKTKKFIDNILQGNPPVFFLEWILTFFTQNIQNIFLNYRIMDYLLVSHPLTIFAMIAFIVIDEAKKFQIEHLFNNKNNELTENPDESTNYDLRVNFIFLNTNLA